MPAVAERPDEQVTGLLTGVGLLRLTVLAWAATVVSIDLGGVTELDGRVAVATLVALAAWTSLIAWWTRYRPRVLVGRGVVELDVVIAAVVASMDHLVYDSEHPQSFASAWPLGAVVTAGILRGPTSGAVAGAVVGTGGAVGTAVFHPDGLDGRWMASAGSLVLLTTAGVLAGVVTDALRAAQMTAARATAREEVARRLHDGVLQTLAAVQRRSDDTDLVALAREQELELRSYIGDIGATTIGTRHDTTGPDPTGSLTAAMRAALATAERRTGVRCELVVVDEPGRMDPARVEALCGAVTEAVTNADKHGGAERVVVCVDESPDGGVMCTVTDDGVGFDPGTTGEGVGLSRSIRGRISEVGGTVVVDSRPGRGCELRLGLPRPTRGPARRF